MGGDELLKGSKGAASEHAVTHIALESGKGAAMVDHDAAFPGGLQRTINFVHSSRGVRGMVEYSPRIDQVERFVPERQELCITVGQGFGHMVELRVAASQLDRLVRKVYSRRAGARPGELHKIRTQAHPDLEHAASFPALEVRKSQDFRLPFIANAGVGPEKLGVVDRLSRLPRAARN